MKAEKIEDKQEARPTGSICITLPWSKEAIALIDAQNTAFQHGAMSVELSDDGKSIYVKGSPMPVFVPSL